MTTHSYRVGQIVTPASADPKSAGPHYEITALLPSEGVEPRYRVRRAGTPERVVSESQIRFVADAPVRAARPSISISKL